MSYGITINGFYWLRNGGQVMSYTLNRPLGYYTKQTFCTKYYENQNNKTHGQRCMAGIWQGLSLAYYVSSY